MDATGLVEDKIFEYKANKAEETIDLDWSQIFKTPSTLKCYREFTSCQLYEEGKCGDVPLDPDLGVRIDQDYPWTIHADVYNVDGYQVKMCASCLTTGSDGSKERFNLDKFMIT